MMSPGSDGISRSIHFGPRPRRLVAKIADFRSANTGSIPVGAIGFDFPRTSTAHEPEIDLGPLTLKTFGIMFALGFLGAGAVSARRFKELGKPPDWAYEMIFAGLIGGIVGARALLPRSRTGTKSSAISLGNLFSGSGLVWYGGAIGGASRLRLGLATRLPRASRCSTLRGHAARARYALGRIGCQVSGDGDYGKAWDGPWAMAYPHGTKPIDTPVQPTPIYETLAMGLVAYFLWRLRDRVQPGVLFAIYLVFAGTERLLVEFIRRNTPEFLGLTQPQLISVGDDDRRRRLAGGKGPPRRAHARRRRRDRAEQGAGLAVLPPRSVPTGPAGPVEHDVVLGDLKTHLAGQPIDGLLELLVVERNHPPADIADEVMVMIASGHERLVPGDSLADLQSPHELHVGQQLERPVDAREPHAVALPPQAGLDLRGGERARLLRQQVDNRQPRLTLPEPRRLQLVDRALAPCGPRIVHRVRAYPGSRPPAAGPVPRMRRDARTAQAPMLTSA